MKARGSVLIVILGLLAILAIVGVALLTVGTVDRQTSSNLAIQTQFDLAADGAVDYACHHLVYDLWEFNPGVSSGSYTALLGNFQPPGPNIDPVEPYDYAKPSADTMATVPDPWLSGPIVANNQPPDPVSFGALTGTVFGLPLGAAGPASDRPNNCGVPNAGANYHDGIWLPDATMPFDTAVVRMSVSIQDHGGLLNLNAHGNRGTGSAWEEADAAGVGFFTSDVDPMLPDPGALLTVPLGRWGTDARPGIRYRGETLLERPILPDGTKDFPFTLDEEWELRRLSGTYFKSRLERIWAGLMSAPDALGVWGNRLLYTTVGWTAEVRGDKGATVHLTDPRDTANLRSARKLDLNLDRPDNPDEPTNRGRLIYEAFAKSAAMPPDHNLGQFVANLVAFRDLDNTFEADLSVGGQSYIGAERQPFFSELVGSYTKTDVVDENGNVIGEKQTWTIKIELYNPWPTDSGGLPSGTPPGLTIPAEMNVDIDADAAAGGSDPANPHQIMKYNACQFAADNSFAVWTRKIEVDTSLGQTLQSRFRSAKLTVTVGGTPYTLDEITTTNTADMAAKTVAGGVPGRLFRSFGIEQEKRGTADAFPAPVVFVYPWQAETAAGDIGTPPAALPSGNTGIPIRILNSVRDTYDAKVDGPLPLRKVAALDSYKAFARLGELNRVLKPSGLAANDWWSIPWVTRVTSAAGEASVKFDWLTCPRAANLFCVGGPWADKIDNDGDGLTDDADKGDSTARGHAGPEFRVPGKVNLNTARPETLDGLLSGVSIPAGARAAVKAAILTPKSAAGLRPMESIAEVLSNASVTAAFTGTTHDDARGELERRDLVFTRLSNIATCRSDTFSVYGTIQLINPNVTVNTSTGEGILRSRRFWAIVDRSPSLAFVPTSQYGLHPRVLNFQWLD